MDRREMIQNTVAGLGVALSPDYRPELTECNKPVMIRVRVNNPHEDIELKEWQRKHIYNFVKRRIEGTPLENCAVFICDGVLKDVEVVVDPRG